MAEAVAEIIVKLSLREASALVALLGKCNARGTGETSSLYNELTDLTRGDLEHDTKVQVADNGSLEVYVYDRLEN